MLYTSLNKIRDQGPCGVKNGGPPTGFRKLMAHLGKTKPDDEPVSFAEILASNGLADALWCLSSIDEPGFCRLLAVKFAREVQHLMRDPRSLVAIDVAERYARGEASAEELAEVRREAWAAYYAATTAAAAACSASAASPTDARATRASGSAALWAEAANANANAYCAASADRTPDESRTNTRAKQAEIFLEMLEATSAPV